jgi:hypothetical protein
MLAAALTSTTRYADRTLPGAAGDTVSPADLEAAHRQAGLDNTNLQASFQHVVAEPGADAVRLQAAFVAVVALQRLLLSLNALRELRSAGMPRDWVSLRDLVRRGLGDLPTMLVQAGTLTPGAVSVADGVTAEVGSGKAPRDQVLAFEAVRVGLQIDTLRRAVGQIGTAGLERETPRAE